jgi:hypothetical protein
MSFSFEDSNILDESYRGDIKIAGLESKAKYNTLGNHEDTSGSDGDEDEFDIEGNKIYKVIPQNVQNLFNRYSEMLSTSVKT